MMKIIASTAVTLQITELILACMSQDFGMFMPKHLAEYYLVNSYYYTVFYRQLPGEAFFTVYM